MSHKLVTLIDMHPLTYFFPSILFLWILYKCLFNKATSKYKNLPPSPPKLPILGHLHKLGSLPHHSLQSMSNRYGELMLIYLGSSPTVIVSSAKIAKEIFKNHDIVTSDRPKSTAADKLLYNSRDIANAPYGEYWRHIRSILVLQLLSNRRVRSYRGVRQEETALLMEKIQQKGASPVNLSAMFTVFTNDITCRVAVGRKCTENHNQNSVDFEDALNEFMALIGSFNVGDFIPYLAWVNKFTGLNERLDKVAKRFDVIMERMLNEHEQKQKEFVNENNDEVKDFVDVLLEIQKDNSAGVPLERDSIKAMILDAFLAGTDTTSTALEWAMTELLRNPRVMEELQKEVRKFAQGEDHISEDILERMKYLKAVIKETLRLHPAVPLLVHRQSTKDIIVNGYCIPSNTRIIFNAWAIQRDPIIWKDANEFCPERFLNSSIDFKGHDFELIPFGSGRRICPGIPFANVNIELVLANLMYKFNWKLPDGINRETLDMSQSSGLSIRRKVPLCAVATPYNYHMCN